MKLCTFCGSRTENSTKTCSNCGSQQFLYICPNCSSEFDGTFCPTCGTRYDAEAKTCPKCGTRYFTRFCTHCGYDPEKINEQQYSRSSYSGSRPLIRGSNSGMVGFIFSILGLMTCMFPFSIVGIVLGNKDMKSENKSKYSTAAVVIGVFGLAAELLYIIIYIIAAVYGRLK